MSTGFEALPPRATGRAAKRRKVVEAPAASASGPSMAVDDASSSSSSSSSADDLSYAEPIYAGPDKERYEYLDHTADVQIHGWGDSLADAFAQTALGVWGYMCDPETIKVDPECSRIIEAKGRDMCSLLFAFLDACLTAFHCDDSFIARDLRVLELRTPLTGLEDGTAKHQGKGAGEDSVFIDSEEGVSGSEGAGGAGSMVVEGGYYIKVAAFGERFVFGKHPQGTEVKAITYSNMQVVAPGGRLFTANDGAEAEKTGAAGGAKTVDASAETSKGKEGENDSGSSSGAAERPPIAGRKRGRAELEGKEEEEMKVASQEAASDAAEEKYQRSVPATHKRRAPFEIFVIVDI